MTKVKAMVPKNLVTPKATSVNNKLASEVGLLNLVVRLKQHNKNGQIHSQDC
jgi:hypothetical protein